MSLLSFLLALLIIALINQISIYKKDKKVEGQENILKTKPNENDQILNKLPNNPVVGQVYFYTSSRDRNIHSYLEGTILEIYENDKSMVIGNSNNSVKIIVNNLTKFLELISGSEPQSEQDRAKSIDFLDLEVGDEISAVGLKETNNNSEYVGGVISRITNKNAN